MLLIARTARTGLLVLIAAAAVTTAAVDLSPAARTPARPATHERSFIAQTSKPDIDMLVKPGRGAITSGKGGSSELIVNARSGRLIGFRSARASRGAETATRGG